MDIRLLGPLQIWSGGTSVDPGPPSQRVLLAVFALSVGTPVPVDVLVDRLWGGSPPQRARESLYVHVAKLRSMLRQLGDSESTPPALERRSGGYALDISATSVDVRRFRGMVDKAREAHGDEARRASLLRQSLDLWRAEPLADLSGPWIDQVRRTLEIEHLDCLHLWAQAELSLGRPTTVIGPLSAAMDANPYVESLAELLMQALASAGRAAEALNLFVQVRTRLVQDLGTDPSPALQHAHRNILRGEVNIPERAIAVTATTHSPAQLPMDLYGFSGRATELKRLDEIRDHRPGPLVLITGTAGVGKTALAVHWAHRVAARFPGGQLHVNLRGFDPMAEPVDPGIALRAFLGALQVPTDQIPTELDAQAGLYRTMLAGRRVLIVLDNARSADQVRPLLPGAPGCAVVVTSRHELTSLITAEGAHPLNLDLLSVDESQKLLEARLGQERTAAEPEAVSAIIDRCQRLPLALAIVTAQASMQPRRSLAAVAEGLLSTRDGLDPLTDDSQDTDLRAVFSSSYRALDETSARLFRLLGIHPGPDLDAPAAANLAGMTLDHTRRLLRILRSAHLINEHVEGRYVLHGLLRAYAGELARTVDTQQERRHAFRGALDYYVDMTQQAIRILFPHRSTVTEDRTPQPVAPQTVTDHHHAHAWLAVEHPTLAAVIEVAIREGLPAQAMRLVAVVGEARLRSGHWHESLEVQRMGLAAAEQSGDQRAYAENLRWLARSEAALGNNDAALAHLIQALEICTDVGDLQRCAETHRALAQVCEKRGDYRQSLHHSHRMLELCRRSGNERAEAAALNLIGWYHALLGEHRETLQWCTEAVSRFRAFGDRHGQAAALDSLAFAQQHLGDHGMATGNYHRALALCREVGYRDLEIEVLGHLADTQLAAGRAAAARATLEQALEILHELKHPGTAEVQARLSTLDN